MSRSAASTGSDRPRSLKAAHYVQLICSATRVEQAVCRWCAARRGRTAPARPRRAGRSRPDRRAQLAPRAALEEVAQRRLDHRPGARAVRDPEADDGVRAAQQRAGAQLVLAARRDPVDDEPPERRQRRERRVEDARRPPPRRRRRRAGRRWPRGSRSVIPSRGSASIAASAPSSSAQLRACPRVEALGDHAAGAERPARARRRASRRRRRAECTTTLSPGAMSRRGPVQVPGGRAPGAAARAAWSSPTASGMREGQRRRRRPRTRRSRRWPQRATTRSPVSVADARDLDAGRQRQRRLREVGVRCGRGCRRS